MGTGDFLPSIIIGLVIAIVPFLAVTLKVTKLRKPMLKAFFFGWLGWLLALIIRIIPLQIPSQMFATQLATSFVAYFVFTAFASALAGIFEEGVRFFILRNKKHLREGRDLILSFGLGWGLGEAIILFVPAMLTLPILSQVPPSIIEIIPGALERNLAILVHISLTFIVLKSLEKRSFLYAAMFLHFIVNLISVSTLMISQSPWITEAVILIMTVGLILISQKLTGRWEFLLSKIPKTKSDKYVESVD